MNDQIGGEEPGLAWACSYGSAVMNENLTSQNNDTGNIWASDDDLSARSSAWCGAHKLTASMTAMLPSISASSWSSGFQQGPHRFRRGEILGHKARRGEI